MCPRTNRGAARCALVGLTVLLFVGCSSEGVRYSSDEDVVQTQEFNPKDLNIIVKKGSDKLVKKAERSLGRQALNKAVIFVAPVVNDTNDHINMTIVQQYLESTLTDLAPVTLVDRGKALEVAKKELKFQHGGLVDSRTAQRIGQMTGANFFVYGTLGTRTTINRARTGESVLYFFGLSMVEVATGKKVTTQVNFQKVAKKGLIGL